MSFNFIIHIGLHKTGSSSIQETFARLDMPEHDYLQWGPDANHSGAFQYAFSTDPANIYSHVAMARTPKEIEEVTQDTLDDLCEGISFCTKPNIIISAEDISTASTESLVDFRNFLAPFAKSIQIYCYVRAPISSMTSAFQQYMKMGTSVDYLHNPEYRERLEHFDDVFGKESVHLLKFDRTTLIGKDVVADFAHHLGIAVDAREIKTTNEALSVEATAALYAHQKLGKHKLGHEHAVDIREAAARILGSVGNGKLTFAVDAFEYPELYTGPDLDWIEQRIGCGIRDLPSVAPNAIHSLDDLLQVASRAEDLVQAAVRKEIDCHSKPRTKFFLNRFKGVSSEKRAEVRVALYLDIIMDILMERFQTANVQKTAPTTGKEVASPRIGVGSTANLSNFFTLEPEHIPDFIRENRKSSGLWIFQDIPMSGGEIVCAEMSKHATPYAPTMPDHSDGSLTYAQKLNNAIDATIARSKQLPLMRSTSGHLTAPAIDKIKSALPDAHCFTFMRDPAQRIAAEFTYCRSPQHPPHAEFCIKYPTLEHFVRDPVEQNKQSLFLIGRRASSVPDAMAEVAGRYTMIGLWERMNPSFVLASSMIWQSQALDLQNRPPREFSLSTTMRGLIFELNRLDYAMYFSVLRKYRSLSPSIIAELFKGPSK